MQVSALTAREAHIARLAADGHTNPEIAAQLYLTVRTAEWQGIHQARHRRAP